MINLTTNPVEPQVELTLRKCTAGYLLCANGFGLLYLGYDGHIHMNRHGRIAAEVLEEMGFNMGETTAFGTAVSVRP